MAGLFDTGSQKTEVKPWEGTRPGLKDLYSSTMTAGQNQLGYFPGSTYAAFNPLQQAGQYGALDYAQNVLAPGFGFQQGTLQDMMMSPQNVMQNPTLQAMMGANASNVADTLQRDWLPQIGSAAVRGGSYGGSRQGIAEGVAMGDAAQALANANAQTLYGAYSDALRQQTAGAQLMPGALTGGLLAPQTAMDIGRQQQGMEQQGINEAMERYKYPETNFWDTLGRQASIYSGSAPYRETKAGGGGGSMIGDVLGLGLTAAGMYFGGPAGGAAASSMNPWSSSGGYNFGASSPAPMPGFNMGYTPINL
jgi:hypothetical protein